MFKKTLLTLLAVLLIAGCSSGNDPVTPTAETAPAERPLITGQSGSDETGRSLWAYFEWTIDTVEETFEAVPIRSAEMHLNVSKFLDATPGHFKFDNFTIDKPSSLIGLDVTIDHPFPSKPNLSGFDVRGILIGSGTLGGFGDSSIMMAGPGDTRLLNNDGLTRWWNPVEFNIADTVLAYRDGKYGIPNAVGNYNCTLNGFKLFSDDLGANESVENLFIPERAVFSTTSANTRHYEIWFPVEDDSFIIRYNYAVDVSWDQIPGYNPGDPVDVPGDFPSAANQPEPFRIDTVVDFNSLYYVNDEIKGGSLTYLLRIYDWQGYLEAGDVADEISEVRLEAPSCLDTSFTGTVIDPGSGTKAYAEYEIIIDGSHLVSSIDCDALITVISSDGDYQAGLTGYTGTAPLALYKSAPFATIAIEAPPDNDPPVADAFADNTSVYQGDPVNFDATGSYDPDGDIVLYEWDFDGDHVFGDPYDSGTDEEPTVIFDELGTFMVDLMVTDDDDDIDVLDVPIEITVLEVPNAPPVAIATSDTTEINEGESVTFDASGSYDPDGTIVSYEWDFDGDGTFGDSWDEGTELEPVVYYASTGSYDVDLRVTDDDDAIDTLDFVITIYVVVPENDPPVADAHVVGSDFWAFFPVEFDATASYDPDGTVVEYLWDFNNDGFYGDPIDGGTPEAPLKYFDGGDHTIDVRVVDNGGKSDYLDVPIQISVTGHVTVTLPEDQDYKSANGYNYNVLLCDTPAEIPIDYLATSAYWDFTGHAYETYYDQLVLFAPSDPEVSDYMTLYPASVQYFTRYDLYNPGLEAWLYMAEEADLGNDILYVHGHVERRQEEEEGHPVMYDEEANGPMALQYPWSIDTDEYWDINMSGGPDPFATLIYHEVGVGEGIATVPFGGTWETPVLLTRTVTDVHVVSNKVASVLLYKWTADDGKQVARLYAVNLGSDINFDEDTFEITGVSRLCVLYEEF